MSCQMFFPGASFRHQQTAHSHWGLDLGSIVGNAVNEAVTENDILQMTTQFFFSQN